MGEEEEQVVDGDGPISRAGAGPIVDVRFAQYGWDPDVPSRRVVLYAVYFDRATMKDLKAIGWSSMGE